MWCRVLQASHPHTAPPTLGLVGVCRNFIFRHAFPGPAGWLCGIAFWRRNGYGRLESGVPHQYVHYMDAERLRQYHTDSSMMARIPRLPSILFNVPEHVLNEIVKDSVNNLEYQLFNSWILCTITQFQLIKTWCPYINLCNWIRVSYSHGSLILGQACYRNCRLEFVYNAKRIYGNWIWLYCQPFIMWTKNYVAMK